MELYIILSGNSRYPSITDIRLFPLSHPPIVPLPLGLTCISVALHPPSASYSDIAQHQAEEGDQINVATAARLAMNMAYQNKEMLQAGLIIAGWDKHAGGTVWGIPLGGTMIPAPYAIGGSGSAYIYGYCDKVGSHRHLSTHRACQQESSSDADGIISYFLPCCRTGRRV